MGRGERGRKKSASFSPAALHLSPLHPCDSPARPAVVLEHPLWSRGCPELDHCVNHFVASLDSELEPVFPHTA